MRNSSQFGSDARASNRRAFFVLREISDVNDLRLHKVAFVRKGVSTYQGSSQSSTEFSQFRPVNSCIKRWQN
jgi:hypothetical protein